MYSEASFVFILQWSRQLLVCFDIFHCIVGIFFFIIFYCQNFVVIYNILAFSKMDHSTLYFLRKICLVLFFLEKKNYFRKDKCLYNIHELILLFLSTKKILHYIFFCRKMIISERKKCFYMKCTSPPPQHQRHARRVSHPPLRRDGVRRGDHDLRQRHEGAQAAALLLCARS